MIYFLVGDDNLGIILPGLPKTMELSGTSKFTKAPGAIRTSLPILMPPIIIEFANTQQLLPI